MVIVNYDDVVNITNVIISQLSDLLFTLMFFRKKSYPETAHGQLSQFSKSFKVITKNLDLNLV